MDFIFLPACKHFIQPKNPVQSFVLQIIALAGLSNTPKIKKNRQIEFTPLKNTPISSSFKSLIIGFNNIPRSGFEPTNRPLYIKLKNYNIKIKKKGKNLP